MTATEAIDATGLVKQFGQLRAVNGIDLDVHQGEIFGVLGPNGAGKTTALRMLATLLSIDSGSARVFGVDVVREPHRVRQLIGMTGQFASVDKDLTATENLWMFGRLQGLRSADAKSSAKRLLGQFGLEDAADKRISEFSGGMRRRLDLAASLITRPPLIFLDEPATGLDPRTRVQMWDTIRGLVHDGCTVLLTTEAARQVVLRVAGAEPAMTPESGRMNVPLDHADLAADVLIGFRQAGVGIAAVSVAQPPLDTRALASSARSRPRSASRPISSVAS